MCILHNYMTQRYARDAQTVFTVTSPLLLQLQQVTKKNRGNIFAIQQASDQTKTSFEQYILSKQMAKLYEWKQIHNRFMLVDVHINM
jgi:hypothetical protein